ncbi:GNAT family N-acetyltransferase [Cellulosimicrobium sp. CpK407]|uniref:GNAT family N-acetyltransferase n=1 Tax=Cellulosimicrobium sp. CpK407 TaxID=3229847 RepID=UPI003F2A67AE
MHELDCDVTHVGSADDSDVLLQGADPLHARIVHDTADEYVLEMIGRGETSSGPNEVLRTGARFTAGPWRLVYTRDEFADHGRPYGGRSGGEGAHQRPQPPRPDYASEHPSDSLTRCELKKPDETSSANQIAIRRSVLVDATADAVDARGFEFRVVNDQHAGLYEAIVDNSSIGGVTYNLIGDDRIVLLAVSVFPEFRGQGIATGLIHRVLDDVRAQGRTVTNYCPVVAAFIDEHPAYADLINHEHPGAYAARRRS